MYLFCIATATSTDFTSMLAEAGQRQLADTNVFIFKSWKWTLESFT